MSIRVIRAGVLDTIQDNGRYGFANWGVNVSGSMDRYAAAISNALAGNDLSAAILEMHFPAPDIIFEQPAIISLTGANFSPHINGAPVPLWRSIVAGRDAALSFRKKESGSRCYLSVHGGFDVDPWLGSFSTNLKIGAGGFLGRALKKDDRILVRAPRFLPAHDTAGDPHIFPWSVNIGAVYTPGDRIGFIRGREWQCLSEASAKRFFDMSFQIRPASDRMGLILRHEPLEFQTREQLISSGVAFGTVQALPDGGLIVLMADHQTTGGYPRLGHIASAHLPRLAQRGVHEPFHLFPVSVEDAEKMVFSLQQDIRMIHRDCLAKLNAFHAQHRP